MGPKAKLPEIVQILILLLTEKFQTKKQTQKLPLIKQLQRSFPTPPSPSPSSPPPPSHPY